MACESCGMPCEGTTCRHCAKPQADEVGRCAVTLGDREPSSEVDELLAKAQELAESERARYHIREARQLERGVMEVFRGP